MRSRVDERTLGRPRWRAVRRRQQLHGVRPGFLVVATSEGPPHSRWRDLGAPWSAVSVATAAAGFAFSSVIVDSTLVVVTVLCSVVPVLLVAIFSVHLRWPLEATAALSAVVWACLVGPLLFGQVFPWSWPEIASGMTSGTALLVDYLPPAPGMPMLLVVPATLMWMAAATGAELARQARNAFLPVTPALSVWAVAVVLALPGERMHLTGAGVALAASMLLLMAGSGGPVGTTRTPSRILLRPSGRSRSAPSSAGRSLKPAALLRRIVGAGTVVAAGVAAGALYDRANLDAMDVRERLLKHELVVDVDVLQHYHQWRVEPQRLLFAARGGGERWWRLATLDRFDGSVWMPTATFRRLGGGVDVGQGVPARAGTVRQAVTLTDGLFSTDVEGALLPSIDRAVRVEGSFDIWIDRDTGTLLNRPGTPRQYTVDSVPARPLDGGSAVIPAGGDVMPYHTRVPAACRAPVTELVETVWPAAAAPAGTPPLEAARQLAVGLGDVVDVRPADDEPASPTCADVRRLVSQRTATADERVLTFVLVARRARLPARVAVGFAPGTPLAKTNSREVRGRDARIWAEVHVAQLGWVPIVIRDDEGPGHVPAVTTTNDVVGGRSGGGARGAGRSGAFEQGAQQAPSRIGRAMSSQIPLTILLILLGAIVLTYVGRRSAIIMRSVIGRRWGSPRTRVVRAWRDAAIRSAAAGSKDMSHATMSELVADAAATLSPQAGRLLERLAEPAGRTLYGAARMRDADATEAWRWRDEFVSEMRRSRRAKRRRTRNRLMMRWSAQ
jgi:hypothetical protein